jgi:hypothetical protein
MWTASRRERTTGNVRRPQAVGHAFESPREARSLSLQQQSGLHLSHSQREMLTTNHSVFGTVRPIRRAASTVAAPPNAARCGRDLLHDEIGGEVGFDTARVSARVRSGFHLRDGAAARTSYRFGLDARRDRCQRVQRGGAAHGRSAARSESPARGAASPIPSKRRRSRAHADLSLELPYPGSRTRCPGWRRDEIMPKCRPRGSAMGVGLAARPRRPEAIDTHLIWLGSRRIRGRGALDPASTLARP